MSKKQIIALIASIISLIGLVVVGIVLRQEKKPEYIELEGRFAEIKTGSTIFINDDYAILLKSKTFSEVVGYENPLTPGDIIKVKFKNITETFPCEAEEIIFVEKVAEGELEDVLKLAPAICLLKENGDDYFTPTYIPSPHN